MSKQPGPYDIRVRELGTDECEEAFVRDFCPYRGSPDPLVVWRTAWQAARNQVSEAENAILRGLLDHYRKVASECMAVRSSIEEQKLFESHFSIGHRRIDSHNFQHDGDAYIEERIQTLWEGWQAARSIPPVQES